MLKPEQTEIEAFETTAIEGQGQSGGLIYHFATQRLIGLVKEIYHNDVTKTTGIALTHLGQTPRTLQFDQDCLNEFESVIRQYKQSKIVIDSSWREWFAFDLIKALFSNDVADKVIGVTPEAIEWVNYFRYYEILDYLKQNNALEETWVAIDDIAAHLKEDAPVILTNKYRGFDKNAARKLEAFFRNTIDLITLP